MLPILNLGPLAIPIAPIVILLGVLVSASLIEQQGAHLGLERSAVSNMVYLAMVAALLGARLGYVMAHLDAFLHDPGSIIMPTPATLDPLWGILSGIVAGALYSWRAKLPLWRTLDALAPGIAAMGMALGIAHLVNGDAFGAPARLPWSIYLWEEYRHPSQIYELGAAMLIFVVWWFLRDAKTFDGLAFLVVSALFAASVILLEALRGDSWLWQGWRAAQLIALIVLAAALALLRLLSQRAVGDHTNPPLQK
jgi:phosphatidylglycerol:prolipoprotein diacylglycerol transferase